MAQRISLPLTVSCFSKIQIGFTFLVLAHPGSPGQRAVKRVCVCVWLMLYLKTLNTEKLHKWVCGSIFPVYDMANIDLPVVLFCYHNSVIHEREKSEKYHLLYEIPVIL